MSLMGQTIEYSHLRAPRADGSTLIEPPLAAAGELIARNQALIAASDYDLQGRRLSQLARHAREQLLREAADYTRHYRALPSGPLDSAGPIVLAGHQPQLFHPGVWFKNFGLSRLAVRQGAVAVNLVIDSDTIKSAALRVPGGSPLEPLMERLAFDRAGPEIPFEERQILDRECFNSFADRAARLVRSLVPHPLVEEFWPLAIERANAGGKLGECLAQARHQLEGRWQASTLELPQSEICGLEAFHWFTSHLLAQLPRLHATYNGAVSEYRRVNHIRSSAHPVPDLAVDGEWWEAPFWIWTRDNPRRRRLFVRRRGSELVLSDRDRLELTLNLSPEGDARRAVEQLAELKAAGIKIRTRALITTLFARLLLGDLFVHGIGGAKYDQVTDLLIARFFGLEPPGYMTVTATLRLPIKHQSVTHDDLRLVEQRLRELTFHPERHVDAADEPSARSAIDSKRQWIATPATPVNARTRCQAIRAANESLQPWVAATRAELVTERDHMARALLGEAILASREYAFCLYPEPALRRLMEQV